MGASGSRQQSQAQERLLSPVADEEAGQVAGDKARGSYRPVSGQEEPPERQDARGHEEDGEGEPSLASDGRTRDSARKSAGDGKEDDGREHATVGRLVSLVRPEMRMLTVATLMLILSSTAQLAQPFYFGRIVESCSSDHSQHSRSTQLNYYTVILLIILAVGGVTTIVRGWLFTLIGERLVRKLRSDLFRHIVEQDMTFFDTHKTGELMNRLSSDTAVIQSCLSVNISMGLRSVSEIIVSIALLFITSWHLTLVMIAVVPVLMVIVILYGQFTRRLTKEYQDALAKAADSGNESIANSRIMKSFGAEEFESNQYAASITHSYTKGAAKAFAYGIFAGGVGTFASLAILIVVYYGATLVIKGQMTIGDLTSFILYTAYIAIDIGVISGLYTEFMNALGASERIFRIMDTEPGIPSSGGEWPASCSGRIEFEGVTFQYPTRPDMTVLRDFQLRVQPNTTVALVGHSGSGKSTVLALLERFYDISSGLITIDGNPITSLDPRWLHRTIAIVPQEPVLFSGSIFSNIIYSRLASDPEGKLKPPATMEEVVEAGKRANAHDFIMTFPEGYETIVGERGVRLSGGQKQRVAIARALLADPKILLLDEATSALDAESEMLVQDAISTLMRNRTVIIIAHRLSTVRDADVIAVFSGGRVVDSGRHEELLQSSSIYANLIRKQLSWATQGNNSSSSGGGGGGADSANEEKEE